MKELYTRSRKELIEEGRVAIETVATTEDLYARMAQDLFDEIENNNRRSATTTLILPVGPVEQYPFFVDLVNTRRLDLRNVTVFNMDEYMISPERYIPKNHTLSFRGFMEREVYGKIDKDLNVPEANRFFPEPGNEARIQDKIRELGGVDLCQGGFGINGHIAFNEPPEEDVSIEVFREYPTRVLPISRETRIVNSMKIGGCYDLMPSWCITVGMKEILSSRKLRFYLNRGWQWGVLRKVLFGEVTPAVPASLLQLHDEAKIIAAAEVADPIPWSN
jgi:glucosamine-6-phosphate deaminase